MNPEMPPPAPPPSDVPPPKIEVRAEPARPSEPGRVFDVPPASSATSSAPPPPPSGPGYVPPVAAPVVRNNAWAMLCHLVGLIDFGAHFIFLGLIATLVVWLMKKDQDPEVDYHGKEALNFQISLFLWWFVSLVLICCVIGIPMLIALPFAKIVLMIIGAVKAANGERWRYPLTLRLIT